MEDRCGRHLADELHAVSHVRYFHQYVSLVSSTSDAWKNSNQKSNFMFWPIYFVGLHLDCMLLDLVCNVSNFVKQSIELV